MSLRSHPLSAVLLALLTTGCGAVTQGPGRSSVGEVRAELSEWVRRPGTPPVILLSVETVETYSCSGLVISHELRRRGDEIRLRLAGIEPSDICLTSLGPASVREVLPLARGEYALVIESRSGQARLELTVTDSSLRLVGGRAGSVSRVDQTWWRRPPESLALACTVRNAPDLCARLDAWIARVPGVERLTFPDGGVDPYRPRASGASDYEFTTYRMTDPAALSTIARCIEEIRPQVAGAVGIDIRLRTWTDSSFAAYSQRSYDQRHLPLPKGFRCTPPPGIAASPESPDTVPAWVRADSSIGLDGFVNGVILVVFDEGTTQGARDTLIREARATLIGGLRSPAGLEAAYLLRLEDPAAVAAPDSVVEGLARKPGVETVSRYYGLGQRAGVFPFDPRLAQGAVADLSRPPVPPSEGFSADTAISVTEPGVFRIRRFRNVVAVAFEDSLPGTGIVQILRGWRGRIIGGESRRGEARYYVIQVPDPGTTWGAASALLDRIEATPGVRDAYLMQLPGGAFRVHGMAPRLAPGPRP